jgi:hypothetical protein
MRTSQVGAINKLAVAGEQAGFSLEQMIQLLDSGLAVETLLELIAWRFEAMQATSRPLAASSWQMSNLTRPGSPANPHEFFSILLPSAVSVH